MKRITKLFFISFLTISLCGASVVFAFNGPGSLSPGTGSGAFQVDSNYNIGFGTNLATPTGDTTNANFGRVFTIASSSDPGLALRNLSTSGGKYIMFARANGRFAIWDDTAGRPRFFIESNGNIGIPGSALTFSASSTLHVNGSIQTEAAFVGSVPASSVVAGAFQSSNYAFPSALAVGTTTIAGLPTGGLYVNGNVGIGIINPANKFVVYDSGSSQSAFEVSDASGYRFLVNTGGNDGIDFYNGSSLKFNADAGGLNFWAGYALVGVNDYLTLKDHSSKSYGIDFQTYDASSYSSKVRILNSGNVGIGTTAPGARLEIRANPTTNAGQLVVQGYNGDAEYMTFKDSTYGIHTAIGGYPVSNIYNTFIDNLDGGSISFRTDTDNTYPGSEKLTILNNGNVGVGITTPAQKLSVAGVIESTTGGFKFPDGTTQTTAGGGGSSSVGWSRTGTYVTLTTSTDYVGIGTTTPTQALHVQGNAYISGNITTGGTMTTNVGASNVSAGSFGTTAGKGNYRFEGAATTNDVLKVDATNERVGVGTASPGYTLDVNGVLNISGTNPIRMAGWWFANYDSTTGGANGIFKYGASQDIDTNFINGGSSRLYIDASTGNIGIGTGTTGPSVRLDVLGSANGFPANSGTAQPNASLRLGNTTTNGILDFGINAGSGAWLQYTNKIDLSQIYPILLNPNGGSVGIGITVPQSKLHVGGATSTEISVGNTDYGGNSGQAIASIGSEQAVGGTGGRLIFKTLHWGSTPYAPTEKMRLDEYGHLGIGTSTPVEVLSVVGNIKATGNIVSGGTMTANVGAGNVSAGTFGTTAGKGNYVFEAAANANNVLKIDATNERVGVGTASPGYQLHLSSSNSSELMIEGSNTNYNNAAVIFKANNGTNQRALGNYYFDTTGQVEWFSGRPYNNSDQFVIARKSSTAAHDQAVAQTSNSLFTILSNGKVGVGTSTPAAMLHALSTTEQLRLGYDNANYGSFTVSSAGDMNYTAGGGDEFDFWNGVTGANYVDIGQGGSGEKQFRMFNGGGVVNLFSTTGNSYITAGNVGIGTTAPKGKFDVQGTYIRDSKTISISSTWTPVLSINMPGNHTSAYAKIFFGGSDWSCHSATRFEAAFDIIDGNGGYGEPGNIISQDQNTYSDQIQARLTHIDPDTINIELRTYDIEGDGFGCSNSTPSGNLVYEVGGNFSSVGLTTGTITTSNAIPQIFNQKGVIGIGTTIPGSSYKLDVVGGARFSNPIEVGSPTASNHATTKSYVDSLITGGGTSGNLSTLIVTGTTTLASTGGAVTIGGAGPALKLNVLGQGQFSDTLSATKYYDYNDSTYYIDPANTGTSEKLAGSIQSDGAGTSYIIGNTLIGVNTNPGSYKFAVSGTSYFSNQVTVNANLLLGTSQNITLQTGNITGVNKITAAIIDPLYEIDGKKYATYGSDTVGVKTEMFGKGKLLVRGTTYSYVIDFAKAEKGSDLWLFWQTIKAGEDMKDVTLTLTSEGERAELWYKLNPKEKQILVYGDAPVKFSYHLVAPRHDAEKWTTKRETDEKASFILKSK